ncbi:MAG: hypothetical protein ABI183_16225 [Polyangiaceae bacterium]
MPGLETIGPIACTVKDEAPTEVEQGFEEEGLFVLGDANDVHHYSGMDLGQEWLTRVAGPVNDLIKNWPNNENWRYHPTEDLARNMYATLRNHIAQQLGNVQFVDAREEIGLNSTRGYGENIVQNGQEIGSMFFDNMADLQLACSNTDAIRTTPAIAAQPQGPRLAQYYTQSDVMSLAIAKSPRGVAEHIAIVFSPAHEADLVIREGMPRAEQPPGHTQKPLALTSGFLVAFWGRASGPNVMMPTQGQPPAPMLHSYLGHLVARPLQTNVPGLDARLPAPAAYAIRVEPGLYDVNYYEMDLDAENGGYSFIALSRQGAPPFQPARVGNAGGKVIGGMSLADYAMMQCEREQILMRQQMNSGPALGQLCAKYKQPVPQNAMGVDVGYAARIVEWDTLIQGNPKLSAEFVAAKTIAGMRLQGIEPSPEQIQAIAQQQNAVAQQLQQAGAAHQDANKQLFEGAVQIIELARTRTPEQIIAEARNIFTIETQRSGSPAHGLMRAVRMLKQPGYEGNPKFANVDQVAEKIALAHYRSMKPEDQKFEGAEKSYVKDVIADVYEKNGVPVPGVGGFLGRFMDKL